MIIQNRLILLLSVLLFAGLAPSQPLQAERVSAGSASPTFIGNVVVGKTYRVTASGVADLYAGWNGGQGLPFTPNGKPTVASPAPYSALYPNGLDYDPSSGPTAYGVGGPQKLYGVLLGTFAASPQSYSEFFSMGDSYVFTASSSGSLYGKINDCCYGDNSGSYSVSLAETGENVRYSYDSLGRLVATSISGGVGAGTQTTYSFDAAGNRIQVKVSGVRQ
jgi:hypothetical protein